MRRIDAPQMYDLYLQQKRLSASKPEAWDILSSDVKNGYANEWPIVVQLADMILHACVIKDQPFSIEDFATYYDQLSGTEQYLIDIITVLCLQLQKRDKN